MKKPIVVSAFAILWLLTLFGAFKIGLHLGPEEHAALDSPAKAALLVRELTALRSGRQEQILQMKEVELDGQVVRALECERDHCGFILWPIGKEIDRTTLLREVAVYRGAHRPAVNDGAFGRDVTEATRLLLQQYGAR
jgi:hypothetical protein